MVIGGVIDKNLYEILGVPKDANLALIKLVYKSLGQIYHPDKYQGDKKYAEEKMKYINSAYSILSDDVKRKEYDNKYNIESEPFINRRENQSFKKKYKSNFNKSKITETFKDIVFGPTINPEVMAQLKAKQKARDIANLKILGLILIGIPLSAAFIFVGFDLIEMIKTNDWFLERLSDRIIPASIFGFILGLGLSNPDDIKENKLRYIKIVFITMITVIFLALLIPKKNSNSNLNNDCKWTKVPGRYSEPDC